LPHRKQLYHLTKSLHLKDKGARQTRAPINSNLEAVFCFVPLGSTPEFPALAEEFVREPLYITANQACGCGD
jgi:hypothetical protein